jgi:hypothetical protein
VTESSLVGGGIGRGGVSRDIGIGGAILSSPVRVAASGSRGWVSLVAIRVVRITVPSLLSVPLWSSSSVMVIWRGPSNNGKWKSRGRVEGGLGMSDCDDLLRSPVRSISLLLTHAVALWGRVVRLGRKAHWDRGSWCIVLHACCYGLLLKQLRRVNPVAVVLSRSLRVAGVDSMSVGLIVRLMTSLDIRSLS